MPKIVDYEEKKQEIIKKAKEVFAKKGYYNTSLSDISKSCGMGRTTMYQYFENKDEIFSCTILKTLTDIQRKVDSVVEDDNLTFIEKLKSLIFELSSEYEHNYVFVLLAEIWIIIKRGNNEIQKTIHDNEEKLKLSIKSLLLGGIEAKAIKPIDSDGMADIIYTFIESIILQNEDSDEEDIKSRIDSVNVLIEGLKA